MANQYVWLVEWMSCYPQADQHQDVVFQVGWRCNATDGTYNATQYGSVNVVYEASQPFIPYAQLTQDEVLGWVYENGVNQTEVQAALDTNIANQVNPPVVNLPLPWAPAPTLPADN